jgi:hypothetical protein
MKEIILIMQKFYKILTEPVLRLNKTTGYPYQSSRIDEFGVSFKKALPIIFLAGLVAAAIVIAVVKDSS